MSAFCTSSPSTVQVISPSAGSLSRPGPTGVVASKVLPCNHSSAASSSGVGSASCICPVAIVHLLLSRRIEQGQCSSIASLIGPQMFTVARSTSQVLGRNGYDSCHGRGSQYPLASSCMMSSWVNSSMTFPSGSWW